MVNILHSGKQQNIYNNKLFFFFTVTAEDKDSHELAISNKYDEDPTILPFNLESVNSMSQICTSSTINETLKVLSKFRLGWSTAGYCKEKQTFILFPLKNLNNITLKINQFVSKYVIHRLKLWEQMYNVQELQFELQAINFCYNKNHTQYWREWL